MWIIKMFGFFIIKYHFNKNKNQSKIKNHNFLADFLNTTVSFL